MKLYYSVGPNPRVVNMFIAEKGLSIPAELVDLVGGANRAEPYLSVNPAGQTPALVMERGHYLSEITAICEYLEELHPTPPLIGMTPEDRAIARMWTRRADLKVCEPLVHGFRYAEGLELCRNRMRVLPEAADGLKAVAKDGLAWIEANMNGPYLAGDRFTLADILLFSFLDFGEQVGQPLPADMPRLNVWFAKVKNRPSAAASA